MTASLDPHRLPRPNMNYFDEQASFPRSSTDKSFPAATSTTRLHDPLYPPMPDSTFPLRSTSRPGSRPSSPQLSEKRPEPARASSSTRVFGRSPYGSIANSEPHLQFAEGDMPDNAVASFWIRMMQYSVVTRWIMIVVPVTALIWIPGIVGVAVAPNAKVWEVKLLFWSIYLTVLFAGWFGCQAVSRFAPHFLRVTLGVIAPEMQHYIQYLQNIKRYLGMAGWALINWICWEQLINRQGSSDKSHGSGKITSSITRVWLGLWFISLILLGEKMVIQVIARNFHKRSYEDRIIEQKFAIRTLTTLYLNSRDIGRHDTLDNSNSGARHSPKPSKIIKGVLKGVRKVAQTGATAIGTVASEFAGERVLQPNSPQAMVQQALASQNKSRQLARRIFYNFVPRGMKDMHPEDISRFFKDQEELEHAFSIFDRDGNGDASLDECEMAAVEIHRERLALASSMRDVDSAVGRLDDILMTVFYVVAVLIIVGMLDVAFNTLIASAGTLILGLSWLIGTTAQEILLSIIFLFVKHPYDVGDRVRIDVDDYVVKEMHLLSTIFRRVDGVIVQMPHTLLNTKPLLNIRRSGPISETFEFHVDYSTTFEQIEQLRHKMLAFLELERRDFFPAFDVTVNDIPEQGQMVLQVPIKYKSNWQNGALKAQRRNKFICALKLSLCALEMYGPAGAGNPHPDDPVQLIKMIPNEPAPAYQSPAPQPPSTSQPDAVEATRLNQFNFSNAENVMLGNDSDIFDGPDAREMETTSPTADILDQEAQNDHQAREAFLRSDQPSARRPEDIEMQRRR